MNNNDPSVYEARRRLQQMYPGLLVSVSCNALDNNDMIFWGVMVSKMKPGCCSARPEEKEAIASVFIAKTYDEAERDIIRQLSMLGIHAEEEQP